MAENYLSGPQYTSLGGSEPLMRSDGTGQLTYTKEVPSIDASDPADGYRWGKFEYAAGATNVLSNEVVVDKT